MAGFAAAAVTKRQVPQFFSFAADVAGDITFYGGGLGACGWVVSADDVAISHELFEPKSPSGNSNANPLCGRNILATANGITRTLRVADNCGGCAANDLDVLEPEFNAFGYDSSVGRAPITWDNAVLN
ncbi:expansin-related protein [Dothistroma septosporum NZE10]|uniref:Expansin-related protein n=1 Tax=Dothistroma septosporum (strain NZE10 / CBS 128990) TaxID=675120 RepID=N1PMW2_DOTSN|nr:expansin-related protein [Dothistroma septosporum NZE10]